MKREEISKLVVEAIADSDKLTKVVDMLYKNQKDLEYHKDTTMGLWATDKPIGDILNLFWQRTSDACPLECTEAENQEIEFKEWVKTISFQIT